MAWRFFIPANVKNYGGTMKVKFCTIMILFMMAASATVAYSQDKKSSIDVKGGTANSSDPGKWGFNSAVGLNLGLDPHFAFALEPGLYWIKWDKGLGITKTSGTITSELKASINAYMYPIMAVAKILIPEAGEGILPYLAPGIGYSIMKYSYDVPAYDVGTTHHNSVSINETYKGFTWQFMVGAVIKPWSDGVVGFVVEAGYRSAKLKQSSFEINMSGFVINAGINAAIF